MGSAMPTFPSTVPFFRETAGARALLIWRAEGEGRDFMRTLLQRLLTLGATAVLVTPGVLAAQTTTDLTGGNADSIWSGQAANANAGIWLDQGAVSSDGRRDLIVGAPGSASVVGKVYV